MTYGKPLNKIQAAQEGTVEQVTEAEKAKREQAAADAKPADHREPAGDKVVSTEKSAGVDAKKAGEAKGGKKPAAKKPAAKKAEDKK